MLLNDSTAFSKSNLLLENANNMMIRNTIKHNMEIKSNDINISVKENRKIYALFNERTVRIYQAYNNSIADEALKLGTFGTEFRIERMTWIKPSFLWMMYRSGWATKNGQERILAIDITRDGFNSILTNAVLSVFDVNIHSTFNDWKCELENSQVRCQWDPDRDINGNQISRRAIQLGIKGDMVKRYVNEWIIRISDITCDVNEWQAQINNGKFDINQLPKELEYFVDDNIRKILGIIV